MDGRRVKIGARKRGRPLGDECGQCCLPASVQILHLGADHNWRLRNGGAQCLHLGCQVFRRLFDGRQRLERHDERHVFGDLLRRGDLVPVVVPLKELVGRRPETGPDHFALVVAHGADGLPVGLQLLHLGRRGIPLGGLSQFLCAYAQRLFAREVFGPLLLLGHQVVAPLREERVARGTESLRQIAGGIARNGARILPRLLKFLELRGGLGPVG